MQWFAPYGKIQWELTPPPPKAETYELLATRTNFLGLPGIRPPENSLLGVRAESTVGRVPQLTTWLGRITMLRMKPTLQRSVAYISHVRNKVACGVTGTKTRKLSPKRKIVSWSSGIRNNVNQLKSPKRGMSSFAIKKQNEKRVINHRSYIAGWPWPWTDGNQHKNVLPQQEECELELRNSKQR